MAAAATAVLKIVLHQVGDHGLLQLASAKSQPRYSRQWISKQSARPGAGWSLGRANDHLTENMTISLPSKQKPKVFRNDADETEPSISCFKGPCAGALLSASELPKSSVCF